jgi:hypothetical protein
MQVEQVKPNKPSFPWVVFWFGTGIILIFVAAIAFLTIHSRKKQSTPYTKHPVSQLAAPSRGDGLLV